MADQKKPSNPDERGAGGREERKQDGVVEKLVPEPTNVPDVRMLVGLIGKSGRTGFGRLYLTPELNSYVEFREEDVVHSQSLAPAENPLGGTAVWVKRDATLTHTSTVSRSAETEFLTGEITAALMAGRGAAGPFAWGAAGLLGLRLPTILWGNTCLRCYTVVWGSCPTPGGEDTCVPATCTLSTSCRTQFLCL